MFKVFPATITEDGRKIPLIKEWQQKATTDPEQHKLWADLFQSRLKHWAIPTGQTNDLLVLDVDVKGGGHETIKSYPVPTTRTQRTISGGTHYFFKYPRDGKVYSNRVKFLPGLDIRSDGGYVMYYGDDGQPIVDAPEWLLKSIVTNPQQSPELSTVRVEPAIAERIAQTALDNVRNAPDGERNNTLNVEAFRVGQLVASGSLTHAYAEAALMRAALECGIASYEAKRTIESGLKGGGQKPLTSPFDANAPIAQFSIPQFAPPTRWTPTAFTKEDLLNAKHLRKPQLFENWSTEDITITTADGGTGKTTLKLFEAVNLALGSRFLGFNCLAPGKTLFITGEDTAQKLGAMIGVIIKQMGLFEDFPGFPEKVQTILDSVIVKKDSDLCLIVKDRQGFINPNGEAFRRIMEAVEDIRPKLIVLDPISSFWGSESALNDMAKGVTKFCSMLVEQSGACVEMLNHMGKSSSANKDMTQFAGRGGSGLPSNARVSRVLRSVFEDEYEELTGENLSEKQSAMMCVVNKFSDGSPIYNKPFLIIRDGFIFTRKNLSEQKLKEQEKNLQDTERVFAFVKESRDKNKFPSLPVIVAHFMSSGDPVPKARVERAVHLLTFNGHMGDRLKLVESPDLTSKDKVFVIIDQDGKEYAPITS